MAGALLFDLSTRGTLDLTGKDAARFLHNLSTHDILDLPVGEGREAFLCNAKARVIAYVNIFHRERDGQHVYQIDTPPGQNDVVLKHLDRYLISEDVQFADRTAELAVLHIAGPETANLVASLKLPDVRQWNRLGVGGVDVLCARDKLADVKRDLEQAGAVLQGPEVFEIMRIEAGVPVFGVDVEPDRFAPEVGRTAQAISYTKGCYLGQEPIVMARDRGHINRLLVQLKLSGEVKAGGKVVRDGAEIGQVTSAVTSPRLGSIAMAYLKRGHWEPETPVEVEGMAGVVVKPH